MYFTPKKDGIKIELSYMLTETTEVVEMDVSNRETTRRDADFIYSIYLDGNLSTAAYKIAALSTTIDFYYCKDHTDFAENIEKYIDIRIEEQS